MRSAFHSFPFECLTAENQSRRALSNPYESSLLKSGRPANFSSQTGAPLFPARIFSAGSRMIPLRRAMSGARTALKIGTASGFWTSLASAAATGPRSQGEFLRIVPPPRSSLPISPLDGLYRLLPPIKPVPHCPVRPIGSPAGINRSPPTHGAPESGEPCP